MKVRAMALLAVGLAAMAGDLLGLEMLHAIGVASHASPAPKVFTAREGLEGFSARYVLHWEGTRGRGGTTELTPEHYARLGGPYNRRNVYGAALAGGPFLSTHPTLGPLHQRVATYAFCEGDVLTELGLTSSLPTRVWVDVLPRPDTSTQLPLRLEVRC
ncbi:MAG: hypothetical protein AAF602_12640 [Myxococcota bacterium]